MLSVLGNLREGDDILNHSVVTKCRKAAQQMEDLLFSVGGAERIVTTLQIFKDRPVVRELIHVREAMQSGNNLEKSSYA